MFAFVFQGGVTPARSSEIIMTLKKSSTPYLQPRLLHIFSFSKYQYISIHEMKEVIVRNILKKKEDFIKVSDIESPHLSLLSIDFHIVCRLIRAGIIVACVQICFRSRYHFAFVSLFLKYILV